MIPLPRLPLGKRLQLDRGDQRSCVRLEISIAISLRPLLFFAFYSHDLAAVSKTSEVVEPRPGKLTASQAMIDDLSEDDDDDDDGESKLL